jgi:hypothetical protein
MASSKRQEQFETIQKGAEAAMSVAKVLFYVASSVAMGYVNIHLHKLLSVHSILKDFLSK